MKKLNFGNYLFILKLPRKTAKLSSKMKIAVLESWLDCRLAGCFGFEASLIYITIPSLRVSLNSLTYFYQKLNIIRYD